MMCIDTYSLLYREDVKRAKGEPLPTIDEPMPTLKKKQQTIIEAMQISSRKRPRKTTKSE